MTRRAYYRDAYTARFPATIVQTLEYNSHPAVILDHTYFYPTSGGQPHDTGEMSQGEHIARVLEVVDREQDEAILHVLDTALKAGEVTGAIDWERRFDHMQHHTGQHILSQAFIRVAEASTISFHLSGQSVTIDLDRSDLSREDLEGAEWLANEIIWENRPVRVQEVSLEEARRLPLRKIPPGRDGYLRLIDIENFDLTACGGTHVNHTGAVGAVKIIKWERRGPATRVEFQCGRRALADYRHKHDVVQALTNLLTTGLDDIAGSISRLQEDNKQLRSELKRTQTSLLALEAERLLADAEPIGPWRLVRRVFRERDAAEVRLLGNAIAGHNGTIALLGISGPQAQLIFCRAADAPGEMGDLIRPALEQLGSARGGGGPTVAQGGGPPADETLVNQAIAAAAARLREVVNTIE